MDLEEEIAFLKSQIGILINAINGKESEMKANAPTFYAWLEKFIDTYKRPIVSAKTFERYFSIINRYIKPNIVDCKLYDIKSADIQEAMNAIEKNRTKRDVYNLLNGAFAQAEKLEIILHNPMRSVLVVNHVSEQGRSLTKTELEKFLQIIRFTKHVNIYKYILLSGSRSGEACKLKKEDIDEENGKIHIRGTKTKGSDRYIPYFEPIRNLFKNMNLDNKQTVFEVSAENLTKHFQRLKREHGFDFTLRDLRHTFATLCYEKGIDTKIVQKWLGHTSVKMTEYYTHISNAHETESAKKFTVNL